MPHESIILISCHSSFLLYCLDKQIKSEHAVVNCYVGWAVSTGCFLPLEALRCCQSLGQGSEELQGKACRGDGEMPGFFLFRLLGEAG